MEIFGLLWDQIIMRPMINSLALLYMVLFSNFGLSILVFTVVVRLAMSPLQIRQTRGMKKMQSIQPKMKALQDKYKGKSREERQQMSREMMQLYREAGVSPVGCLGPLVLQMPIFIGMYRAILRTMPPTPEGLAGLSHSFYFWNPAVASIPFNSKFIGIDLVDTVSFAPTPWQFVLPVLVGATLWLQQKMTMNPAANADPRTAQTNQIMLWMMPVMFGFFTYQFPAGLAVYILFSNIIGVLIQYFIGGRQPIVIMGRSFLGTPETRAEAARANAENAAGNAQALSEQPGESESNDDTENVHGQERRRGNRERSSRSRRQSRRRRNKGR